MVAALVAEAFCGLPSASALKTTHRLTHRNGDPADNRPANLLVLSRNIRSDRDVALAQSLQDSGLTLRLIRRLTGVSAKVLRRRRPPSMD